MSHSQLINQYIMNNKKYLDRSSTSINKISPSRIQKKSVSHNTNIIKLLKFEKKGLQLIQQQIQRVSQQLIKLQQFYDILNEQMMKNQKNDKKQQKSIDSLYRCYKHKNQIILFCLTENELLCPNCIFKKSNLTDFDKKSSSTQSSINQQKFQNKFKKKITQQNQVQNNYKNHKGHQIKQFNQQIYSIIQKNNQSFTRATSQKLRNIQKITLHLEEFMQKISNNTNSALQKLQKSYQSLQKSLNQSFQEAKQNIISQDHSLRYSIQDIIKNYSKIKNMINCQKYQFPVFQSLWNRQFNLIIYKNEKQSNYKQNAMVFDNQNCFQKGKKMFEDHKNWTNNILKRFKMQVNQIFKK